MDNCHCSEDRMRFQKELYDAVSADSYAKAIADIFCTLNILWGFYAAHVRDLPDAPEGTLIDTHLCIETFMLDLAASMVVVDETVATNILQFRQKVRADYRNWFTSIRNVTSDSSKLFYVDWMMNVIGLERDTSMPSSRVFQLAHETVSA
jgi:hypothetical protein